MQEGLSPCGKLERPKPTGRLRSSYDDTGSPKVQCGYRLSIGSQGTEQWPFSNQGRVRENYNSIIKNSS